MERKRLKLNGIVAKSTDYKESDKLVTLITENGSLNAIVKGVRSEKAKLKLAVSLFSFCEYSCLDGEPMQVISATVLDPHTGLWTDIKKYSAASIISEAAEKLSREGNETKEEYLIAVSCLELLECLETSPFAVAIWGLLKLMSVDGADINEYTIATAQRNLLNAFFVAEPNELDALEYTEAGLADALLTLSKIFTHAFGIKLNSVLESVKAV